MLHIGAEVTQQLGKEIEAAMTSMAAMAEINTHITVEGMCHDVQAQIEQNHADAQCQDEESKQQVEKIVTDLLALTQQLN